MTDKLTITKTSASSTASRGKRATFSRHTACTTSWIVSAAVRGSSIMRAAQVSSR